MRVWSVTIALAITGTSAWAKADVMPLPQGHSHNDYTRSRPLEDALECGFCSVEADIHLVDGKLLVAHDRDKVQPGRTLESLYLEPLRKRARESGGRIYKGGPEFTLLVDIKGDPAETWTVLRETLGRYADILTSVTDGRRTTRAVWVVLSGNRPRQRLTAEPTRLAAIDGELSDLDSDAPADLIPQISAPWQPGFAWRGIGPMSEGDRSKLKSIVDKAHAKGRKVRFWGAPESAPFLTGLLDAGVDIVNVDNVKAARDLLLARRAAPAGLSPASRPPGTAMLRPPYCLPKRFGLQEELLCGRETRYCWAPQPLPEPMSQ